MGKQKLTFVDGKYFVGDENGIQVVKEVFIKLLEGEDFAGNTGFGSLMAQTQQYHDLLQREQQDMKLLNDMIEKGLPVESYIHLVKYKLKQLTRELQEYNRKSMENVLGTKLPLQDILDK
jgi:hypothetical protein